MLSFITAKKKSVGFANITGIHTLYHIEMEGVCMWVCGGVVKA